MSSKSKFEFVTEHVFFELFLKWLWLSVKHQQAQILIKWNEHSWEFWKTNYTSQASIKSLKKQSYIIFRDILQTKFLYSFEQLFGVYVSSGAAVKVSECLVKIEFSILCQVFSTGLNKRFFVD